MWWRDFTFGFLVIVVIVGLFMVAMNKAARADVQYPVAVPGECSVIAAREGVPLVIESKAQGLRARAKLALLSRRDPAVILCREAVERMRKAAR